MPIFQLCSYNILAQIHIVHNLHAGIPPAYCDWSSRKQKLQNVLEQYLDVFVIGMQEVEENFCSDIKPLFKNHTSYYESRPHHNEGLLLLIHNRCIIENYSTMILYDRQGNARRVVQIVDCLYERTQFRIINVHLDYDVSGKTDGFDK